MEYVRKVDLSPLGQDGEGLVVQWLYDRESGAKNCSVLSMRARPGVKSAAGLHTHPNDQVYYILSGTLGCEIGGKEYAAGPGTLVIFPAGVPHRNWITGTEQAVILSVQAPLAEPGAPLAVPVSPS